MAVYRTRIHILLISNIATGILYQPIPPPCHSLASPTVPLAFSAPFTFIRSTVPIARRQLEHNPFTFANHPQYTASLRPPPPVDPP